MLIEIVEDLPRWVTLQKKKDLTSDNLIVDMICNRQIIQLLYVFSVRRMRIAKSELGRNYLVWSASR